MLFPENELIDEGGRLGTEAANYVERTGEKFVVHECERIALVNEPQIRELAAEGQDLTERRASLQETLRGMAPPEDLQGKRRRKAYYAVVGILLILTGFAFTVVGFEPFRLGMIGALYCLGIALVAPFTVDEFLAAWNGKRLLPIVITIAFVSAITGGVLLAVVRGELLARKIAAAETESVVIEDAGTPPPASEPSFYARTEIPLRVLMVLFGLAIELAGGIAVHRARAERIVGAAEYMAVKTELAAVNRRLWTIVAEITTLQNEPAVFAARFWRDFYRSMLVQAVRNGIGKIVALSLLACVLLPHRAIAEDRLNLVVAFDLSGSEAVKMPDEKSPFERNVESVAKLLASLPPGARVTVVKISEDSIRNPFTILSGRLSDDPGYFGERLAAGRNGLIRAWRDRMARLSPTARGTDILGTLHLASDIFKAAGGGRKTLILYSDMRNHTRVLDLERPKKLDVEAALRAVDGKIADLAGVTVYVVGANGGGSDLRAWQLVKRFWMEYFTRAGADCAGYSMLTSVPAIVGR